MYHIYFIHPSVEGQLDNFKALAVMNQVTMNILEYLCGRMSNLLGMSVSVLIIFQRRDL